MKKRLRRFISTFAVTCMAVTAVLTAVPASAAAAFTVYVDIGGEETLVKSYSSSELSSLTQTQAYYSSIDAAACPVVIAAEGITLDTLYSDLGIPSSDAVTLKLKSSDGWSRSFSAAEYGGSSRKFYSGIVDGYLSDSDSPPEFAEGTQDAYTAVTSILALKSYEGRFESAPSFSSMSSSAGIRFCFGQTSIFDTPMLNYGKYINSLTIVLSDSTSYIPPEPPDDPSQEPADDPSDKPQEGSQGEAEEIDTAGLTADTLTITVGYYGGTYYTKKVFSLSDLEALPQVKQVYSYLDNMPAVCLDSAVGVKLTDILEAAGIDVSSIHSFHFYCSDVARTWYTSFTKSWLLDTVRYYYPNLPTCWDYDEAEPMEGASQGAVRVYPILALKENWRRLATEEGFANMTTDNRFRLLYGQSDVSTVTGSNSAKWVHTIAVTLVGSAPKDIKMDVSALDLEVGSKYQLNAQITDGDYTTDHRVTWSSSDESVVKVDSNGKITVVGEGSATVTVTTAVGGLTASAVINGKTDETGAADTPQDGNGQTGEANDGVYEISGEGQVTEVTPPSGTTSESSGRVYELNEDSTVLAEIEVDNPLNGATLAAGLVLFFGGAAVQTAIFFKRL